MLAACASEPDAPFSWEDLVGAFDPALADVELRQPDAGSDDDTSVVTDAEPSLQSDGAPCDTDADCAGGSCLSGDTWPNGYCSTFDCIDATACSSEASACIAVEEAPVCLGPCDDGACREGYSCTDVTGDGGTVCLPAPSTTLQPDGRPCTADDQCRGGTCLLDPAWPAGHCTTVACRTGDECAFDPEADVRCLLRPDQNLCVRLCGGTSECRENYECQPLGGGIQVCLPAVTQVEEPIDEEESPWDINCDVSASGGTALVAYEIAADTTSYMVVPWTRDGRRMTPFDILLPDGSTVDLRGRNSFQIANSYLFGWINPLVIPAVPNDVAFLQPGEHVLRISTTAPEVCFFVHQQSETGVELAMNIYLAGVPGISSANAGTNAEMSAMFRDLDNILGQAGIETRAPNFIDVDPAVATRWAVPLGTATLEDMFRSTTVPDEDDGGAMSINIFLTRAFALRDAPGAIGISFGLPGAAGLHGTSVSGVAFTTEYLFGDPIQGPALTAGVMAHEIGHYLGLFHTTETDGNTTDPLADTPNCVGRAFPSACPDLTNLMFPYAGSDHTVITSDQAFQLMANPLTRPR